MPSNDFDPNGQVNDGTYAIVVPTANGYNLGGNQFATWMSGVSSDHTSSVTGVDNGGAMFINVNLNYSGPVFEAQFDGICSGKEIFLAPYFHNL